MLSKASAQKVILRDDIKDPEELRQYDLQLDHYNAERERRKPLYLQSAKLATEKLSDEILKGNMDYAIANIYDRWKKKLSMRFGGEAKLIEGLKKTVIEMHTDNTVITDIQIGEPKHIYYVWMQRKKGMTVVTFPFDYTFQKLVIVPMTQYVTFNRDPKTGGKLNVEKNTYQLAVYDENSKKWSFISSNGISINDLRGLFPTLPLNIKDHFEKSGKVLE